VKVYKYNKTTKEFIREVEAILDPLEGKPLCPANATFKEPEEALDGYVKCFINNEWVDIEDHRNKEFFNINTKQPEKHSLGPVPNHFTFKAPKEFAEWNFEAKKWKGHEENKKEWDLQEYARDRQAEYPYIGDQLDALYHAGLFPKEMAAKLKAVKDKYPKSELPNGN